MYVLVLDFYHSMYLITLEHATMLCPLAYRAEECKESNRHSIVLPPTVAMQSSFPLSPLCCGRSC